MSTSSGFSNFIPRFNKTKDSPSSSSSTTGPSLSPSKEEGRSRRSSFSLSSSKRSPSPSPSPALSTKSSFSDFALSSRSRNQDSSQTSDATARIKAPAPPPKLTLTDVEHSESSIHVPSPISTTASQGFQRFGSFGTPSSYDLGGGMSGSLGSRTGLSLSSVGASGTMGWEDDDQVRTPTGDKTTDSVLGLGFGAGGLGEGSLTLEDATAGGPGGRKDTIASDFSSASSSSASISSPSSSRPNSYASDQTTTTSSTPPKPSSSSTRSNGSSSSHQQPNGGAQSSSFPTPSTSQSSLNGFLSSSQNTTPTSSLDPPKPSKRRLSASSFHRSSSSKPSGGIAAAIHSMSKDLVNPAANMRPALPPSQTSFSSSSSNRASSPTPTNRSATFSRPRAGTGSASIPSSITSEDSRKSGKSNKSNKSSMKSLNAPVVNGTPRTSVDEDMRPSRDSVESSSSSYGHGEANTNLGGGPYGEMNGNGNGHGGSELGDYDDDDEEDEDDEDGGMGGYDDDLDDLPVTGFAVASAKRNHDFHLLFKEVPEVDYLIEDYGCALQRDILVQGRLYVSENHVCFHASIFGWVTNMVIPFSEILRIDKKMTAFVIPNAIMISTLRSKYTWASFLSRDTTYDVIHNIWRLSHPHLPSFSTEALTDDGAHSTNGQTNSQGSVGDEINNGGDPYNTNVEGSHTHSSAGGKRHLGLNTGGAAGKRRAAVARKPTTCSCGLKGEHYSETALDVVFPSTPEKIYNLMFTSGFAKDFMSGNQRLMDIQTSDWAPSSTSGDNNLTRKMSYIKPLPGGFGPKQTKCELQDETVYVDFDDYVSMVTTTRTPDVPSGGSFSVKTRTCLMWAGGNSTRVLVTCQVDWTGRSFIRGIIDSSALAGQKSFHADQETAMRSYITDHLTEFHTEGLTDDDPASLADLDPLSPTSPPGTSPISHTATPTSPPDLDLDAQSKLKKLSQEGWSFQYGVDTLTKGVTEIFKGLWAIGESLGSGLTMQGFFGIVIAALLISNVWTFLSLRGGGGSGREEARGPPGSRGRVGGAPGRAGGRDIPSRESPDSVAEAVKSFLEDYITRQESGSSYTHSQEPLGLPEDELSAISSSLDALERRIESLRRRLPSTTRAIGSEPSSGGLEELD
ncbi:hypothetical protein BDY24DRAFT_350834 [Mrakia frigida]|uniref:GRAM and VASt domain-containing protein n=1 Tax=Mrakia frigida TaxID=29902 RepID=UPI003FCBF736